MANQPANYPPPVYPPTTTRRFTRWRGTWTYDAAAGVAKDNWVAQVIANNFTELECEPVHIVRSIHRVDGSGAGRAP